jgi:hypothetical protein
VSTDAPANPFLKAVTAALSKRDIATLYAPVIAAEVLEAATDLYGTTPRDIKTLLTIANRCAARMLHRSDLAAALDDLLIPGFLPALDAGDAKIAAHQLGGGGLHSAAQLIATALLVVAEAVDNSAISAATLAMHGPQEALLRLPASALRDSLRAALGLEEEAR